MHDFGGKTSQATTRDQERQAVSADSRTHSGLLKRAWAAITRLARNSTSEEWAGTYWHDGKKIYRKIVDTGTLPNAGFTDTASGITGADIDFVTRLYGAGVNPTGAAKEAISLPNSDMSLRLISNMATIRLSTTSNYNDHTTSYVTIEYTKA